MANDWGDIQTAVEMNLGKSGDANVATLLPIWANSFQKAVQRDRNWWFLKTVAERTIGPDAQSYPLPSNFKEGMVFYLKQLLSRGDPANSFIELDNITDMDVVRTYQPVDVAGSPASQKAQPEAVVIDNMTVTVWPWPDKVYVLRSQYWKDMDPPQASSPTSFVNAWITNFPDLYIAALTAWGFKYLQEWADAKQWDGETLRILADVRAAFVARELPDKIQFTPVRDAYGTTRQATNSTWKVYN